MDKREIEALLGLPTVPVEGNGAWSYAVVQPDADWAQVESLALERIGLQEQLGAAIVAGMLEDGVLRLYVIPDLTPVELVARFRVGTRPGIGATGGTARCTQELAAVEKIIPFHVYSAGSSGFKCKFAHKATLEQAQRIEDILTVGMVGYVAEMTEKFDSWNISAKIAAENGIRLRWD